jgi:hypothetical protein
MVGVVAGRHVHLRSLVTAIHETSGLFGQSQKLIAKASYSFFYGSLVFS